MTRSRLNITGQRYGRLVAIEPTERRENKNVVWRFRCDCGGTREASAAQVRNGNIKSCGCLRREISSALRRVFAERRARLAGSAGSQESAGS